MNLTDQKKHGINFYVGQIRKRTVGVFIGILLLLFLMPALNVFAEGQAGSSYIVKRGDCLYSIAKNVLGDGNRWREIYERNKDSVFDPNLIFQGQELILPGIGDSQVTASDRAGEEQARQVAKKYLAQAVAEEPAVTAMLQKMESDACYLQGLENRIKSEDSLTRKILTDAADEGISVEEAAAKIADNLRYTMCIREDAYVSTATATLQTLTNAGCLVVKFKNTWGGNAYKGINTQLKTPGGYLFELQFHTPASFESKEEEHKYYEILRLPETPPEETERLEKLSQEIFMKVPVPNGASEFSWNNVGK